MRDTHEETFLFLPESVSLLKLPPGLEVDPLVFSLANMTQRFRAVKLCPDPDVVLKPGSGFAIQ